MKKFKTEPKYIEIKDVNRTTIKMVIFNDYKLEDIAKNELLGRILRTCNNKYRDSKQYELKKDELLVMRIGIYNTYYINKCMTEIELTIPKEDIIEEFNLEECIKFFHEAIYNPYVENNEFNNEHFNWEKDFIYNRERNYKRNIYNFIDEEMTNYINKIEDIYLPHDEYVKIIEQETPKSLYEHYKNTIQNSNFITYIYGPKEDKEKVVNAYNKYFKPKQKSLELDIEYYKYLKLTKYEERKINTEFNQSVLIELYQVKDFKKEEHNLLDTLYFFLNSEENNLIFKNLRIKNNLVYTESVKKSTPRGFIGITAYLNKNDIKKAQNLIKETINEIKIEENFNLYKENLLKSLKYDMLDDMDNTFKKAENIIGKELEDRITTKERYEEINKINYKDMKKFIEKLERTRTLTLIGDHDE